MNRWWVHKGGLEYEVPQDVEDDYLEVVEAASIERLLAENRELRAEVASYREMIREGGLDQGTP